MNQELFFRKTKTGYEVYDRNGNTAFGITKEIAKLQYNLLFGEREEYGIDISNYNTTKLRSDK